MTITPEQQHANRLSNAYCDILSEMDNAYSYTLSDDRYDIWRLQEGEFKRAFVAMEFAESKRIVQDFYSDGDLVLLVPHVQVDSFETFLVDIAVAGMEAAKMLEQAKAKAELPKPCKRKSIKMISHPSTQAHHKVAGS